jgi:hypothetical protein
MRMMEVGVRVSTMGMTDVGERMPTMGMMDIGVCVPTMGCQMLAYAHGVYPVRVKFRHGTLSIIRVYQSAFSWCAQASCHLDGCF